MDLGIVCLHVSQVFSNVFLNFQPSDVVLHAAAEVFDRVQATYWIAGKIVVGKTVGQVLFTRHFTPLTRLAQAQENLIVVVILRLYVIRIDQLTDELSQGIVFWTLIFFCKKVAEIDLRRFAS